MTKKSYEIAAYLKSNIPKATLLYGDNFLVEYYGRLINKKINEFALKTLNTNLDINKIYFDEYNFQNIFNTISQNSLFGDATLVHLKLSTPFSDKELKQILQSLEHKDNSNFLLIEIYDVDYNATFKKFSKEFNVTSNPLFIESRLFAPNIGEMMMLMKEKVRELNLSIDDSLLRYMLEIYNFNLLFATNELNKLLLRADRQMPVSKDDILSLCDGVSSYNVDELIDALFSKKSFIKILNTMESSGTDEREIINGIGKFFYTLFLFRAYIKIHGHIDVKEILGYQPPKHISDRYINNTKKIEEEKYIKIFDIINKWKIESKQSSTKHFRSLSMLCKIQDIL